MIKPEDEIEAVIGVAIWRYGDNSLPRLVRAILDDLREAGYEVMPRPDAIPIRRNPGEDRADD